MNKYTIIWLGITSLIATLLLWIFHGTLFAACYSPFPGFKGYIFIADQNLANCLIYASSISFLALFFIPLIVTLVIYGIYVIIFNHEPTFSRWVMWFNWLIVLYYIMFLSVGLPAIW